MRSMKEKLKRSVSLFLTFALLLGMLTHLSVYSDVVEEPITVEAATLPTHTSDTCPYGGETHQNVGMAICAGCGGYSSSNLIECAWDDCPVSGTHYAVGGRMYLGNGILNSRWYNSGAEEVIGTFEISNHRAPGYNTKKDTSPDDGCSYHIDYYACYNCVGGQDNSYKYDEVRIMWTEHYASDGTLDTEQGNNGVTYDEDYGETVTSITSSGNKYTFELVPGEGVVQLTWCSYCGPLIWEENGYPKDNPNSDKDYINVGDAGIQPCVVDELKEKTLHINEQYTLTLSAPLGGKVSLDGETYKTTVQGDFYEGDPVKIYAKANDDYGFDTTKGWTNSSGNTVNTAAEAAITMPGNNYTLYANFEQTVEKYPFKVVAGDGGSVNDEVNGEYAEGFQIPIHAIPDSGKVFAGWTGEGWANASSVKSLGASDAVKMPVPSDKEKGIVITASFATPTPTPVPTYKISLSVCEGCDECDGADSATYDIGTVGFSSKTVDPGTKVTIKATAKTHYEFSHWTNSVDSSKTTDGSKEVEVKMDQSWVAHFKCRQYTVKVEAGDGGTVNEDEVNNKTYTHKDTVIMKATPEEGYRFEWWHIPSNKMGIYSVDAEYSIQVKKDAEYKASFVKTNYEVTAEIEPAGAGTVSGAGRKYNWDANVSLSASPNTGYKFVGWSSEDVTISADGKFTMPKKAVTVTAHFEATGDSTADKNAEYKVTVNVQPSGAGSAAGEGTYKAGDSVSIVPTAADGYALSKYRVEYNGTSSDYTSMDYPEKYEFSMPTYDVAVAVTFEVKEDGLPDATPTPEAKAITVTFDPDGGTVNPTSKKVYPDGTYGTLPTPKKDGYTFLNWVYKAEDGDSIVDAGTQVQCEEDHTLVAEYEAEPTPVPTVTPEPTAAPVPTVAPHVCVFGPWKYHTVNDGNDHWKECVCGAKSEEGKHEFEKGAPDETGQTTSTCKVCGYSYSAHVHDWQKWYPTYPYWPDYDWFTNDWISDWELEQFPYDAETYHWQTCSYESCGKSTARMTHTKGELKDEGDGYQRARCTVCGWVMEEIPIKVNLTINPNGGAFPDGSTEPVTFKDIEFGSKTGLNPLGSEYFPARTDPEKGEMSFLGYYIVEINLEDCMYTPDYETKTSVAKSKYFSAAGFSKLTRDYVVYAQWGVSEYSVVYDKNEAGATGKMSPGYFKVGEEKALSGIAYYFTSNITYNVGDTPAVVATTYDNTTVPAGFLGWAKTADGGVAYTDKQVVKNLLDRAGIVTLYAVWDYGSVILPNATATDGGQKLSGWKKTDGTFISVLDENGNYKAVTYPVHGDETFTAVWVPNTYTVTFDSDGGTACDSIEVTYRKTYSYGNSGLPSTTKEGYTFQGWKHALTAEMITGNSIVTTAADHTLVAVWEPVKVTVTLDYNFDFNGAAVNPKKNTDGLSTAFVSVDGSTDKTTADYGTMIGTLPVPEMEGCQFAGWYLEEDAEGNGCGENSCLASGSDRIAKTGDYTIHARWTKNQYRVDLDYNRDYSVWEE